MAREKQHVFSARTTEEGLKALNEVKARLNISWDELVIEAVSAHYNLDNAVMSLPRKEKPANEAPATEQQAQEKTEEERPEEAGEEKSKKSAKKAVRETAKETDEDGIQ